MSLEKVDRAFCWPRIESKSQGLEKEGNRQRGEFICVRVTEPTILKDNVYIKIEIM
jgi:hypothetical protein